MAYGGREGGGGGRGGMESVVFIFSLIDCCALIFLSVYFVSFSSGAGGERPGRGGVVALWLPPRPAALRRAGPVEASLRAGERGRGWRWVEGERVAGPEGLCWVTAASGGGVVVVTGAAAAGGRGGLGRRE